jgi:hypothetical protein
MENFSPLGFDTNFSFGQQSVFTVVDTQWQVFVGPSFEMITESGILMETEDGLDEMITE